METKVIQATVYSVQKHFEQVMPQSMAFKREADWAVQLIAQNEYLQKCDEASIRKAIYSVALTGLSLNPALSLAYLVPMGGKCTLFVSYKGMSKIVMDMGGVRNIIAELVFEGDEFEVVKGTTPSITHKPKFKSSKIIAAYSVAFFHDDTFQFEVMTYEQIMAIKARSQAAKKGFSPWSTDEAEMCRKTVLRRIVKYLPLSETTEKINRFSEAIALENEQTGIDFNKEQKSRVNVMDAADAEIIIDDKPQPEEKGKENK
jgi:recombination protein RecT